MYRKMYRMQIIENIFSKFMITKMFVNQIFYIKKTNCI